MAIKLIGSLIPGSSFITYWSCSLVFSCFIPMLPAQLYTVLSFMVTGLALDREILRFFLTFSKCLFLLTMNPKSAWLIEALNICKINK